MDRDHPIEGLAGLSHSREESHFLRELIRAYQALLNAFSHEVGAPASRLMLLRLLATSQPEALGTMAIARRLGVNAAAVTRQLNALEAEGMVAREADARDNRRTIVRLTAAGMQEFLRAHESAHEFERRLASAVSSEDLAIAIRVLAQVRASLGDTP